MSREEETKAAIEKYLKGTLIVEKQTEVLVEIAISLAVIADALKNKED